MSRMTNPSTSTPFAPGFDPKWRDFPDFILGITHEIWEERRINRLHDYYAPDLIVRSPAGIVQGNTGVIAATQSTLAEFPDRELPGEDVIWCDDDGLLSSHRLLCWATHLGSGLYGKASGKPLRYRILADCFCADNQVRDEWLVRDQSAIVQQMGADLVNWTRHLIAREGGPDHCIAPFSPYIDREGPYQGRGNRHPLAAQLSDHLETLAKGTLDAIPRLYDSAATLQLPGHTTHHGHVGATAFWLPLFAAVPAGTVEIHHAIGREDPGLPPRAAVRWSLTGTHTGHGRFGAPTNAPVHIMGITHAEFGPETRHGGPLKREWTLIDDTAIWKQILLKTGAC